MDTTKRSRDGRRVQRERRRDAILASVRAMADSPGREGFTVDQVAEHAGVSRRTVFNHFATVEDLLVAVCEQILEETTAQVLLELDRRLAGARPVADGGLPDAVALDALCAATRDADLPRAMTAIVRVLDVSAHEGERGEAISQAALDHVGGRLAARVTEHAPDLDPLVLQLTIALLMNGIGVIAHRWLDEHAGRVTPASRRSWDDHLARLLDQLAHGYARTASSGTPLTPAPATSAAPEGR